VDLIGLWHAMGTTAWVLLPDYQVATNSLQISKEDSYL
jgi:hypothetical protein